MRQRCLYEQDVKCPFCELATTKLGWDGSMPRSCRPCQMQMIAKIEAEEKRTATHG